MRHLLAFRRVISGSQKFVFATLFLSVGLVGLAGCDTNSCILVVSNPGGGGGTISGNGPNCSLGTTTVSLQITSSLSPAAGEGQSRIQHVFVTLRGIDANPNASAAADSPDWQELAPTLAKEPMQLDLLDRGVDSCEANITERVAVPADAYRQLRLRLSPNQPETTDSVLQQNSCGSAGFNCVVTSDGNIRPLVLDRETSQIQVSSAQISGGFFRISPDAPVNLKIEFNPQSSQFIAVDQSVHVVPVFTAESHSPCESADVANR
ncbi:MAG TPA: DUF4382 domain-containing protein [Candidatus Acidoferrales bacterium]|nr:DUF4382 domain-containing protein [Candidatus Acidoferrales bacterium]